MLRQYRVAGQRQPGRDEIVVDLGVSATDPGPGFVRPHTRQPGSLAMIAQQVAHVVHEHAAEFRRGPVCRQFRVRPQPPALVNRDGSDAGRGNHSRAENPAGQVRVAGSGPQPGGSKPGDRAAGFRCCHRLAAPVITVWRGDQMPGSVAQ
ncbi:MAG TPA: hypothetical protein VMA72_10555 [Streptosporangiaceae bacterium]|nr:hypothetical protein [Streptosporangiaceae bacterium]